MRKDGIRIPCFCRTLKGIVKLREIPAFSTRNQSALERRINNLETAMKRS